MSEEPVGYGELKERVVRMRPPVKSVYDRQTYRCLRDLEDMNFTLPDMVKERIKRAIEYTCKDVDKLKKESGNGYKEEENFNR